MPHRPVVSERLYEKADEVCDEYDLSSIGEALRHMAREGGYDV